MARIARLVVPGYPHHVTQRGVRSLPIFSDDGDRRAYLDIMAEQLDRFGVGFQGHHTKFRSGIKASADYTPAIYALKRPSSLPHIRRPTNKQGQSPLL